MIPTVRHSGKGKTMETRKSVDDFPGGSVTKTLGSQRRWGWVRFLVRELIPHPAGQLSLSTATLGQCALEPAGRGQRARAPQGRVP